MQYTAQKHYDVCKNSKLLLGEEFDKVKLEVPVPSPATQGSRGHRDQCYLWSWWAAKSD
jgi:hypothetical protein